MNTNKLREVLVMHSAPKAALADFDATVSELAAHESAVKTDVCPHCNTAFEKGTAPWLMQKNYCRKHDRVSIGECELCTPDERLAAAQVSAKQQHDAANDSRVAQGQEPVAWKEV
jgi:hypothetical protein